MRFFVGLHHPWDAWHFERAFISVNRLVKRKRDFDANGWIMDSGAFTEISTHGHYRDEPETYAARILRWAHVGFMEAAVSQDFMCEPFILAKTGASIADHQQWTVDRYDRIHAYLSDHGCDIPLMPVLQGWTANDYMRHAELYGARLGRGHWVGVGSICKRNSNPAAVIQILRSIRRERPELNLHGFGLKITALSVPEILGSLHSADSMAWSFTARRNGGDANHWTTAAAFVEKIEAF